MSAEVDQGMVRVTTPEGVELDFRLADLGHRALAFGLDLLLLFGAILGIGLIAFGIGALGVPRGFVIGAAIVVVFLFQSFYFVVFELRWQGSTPGKRHQKVRVVSRDGGPLTVGMVFARNLTRQVELTLPLVVLMAPGQFMPEAPGWSALLGVTWAGALLFFPALNRHRARLGDLAAGTLVIMEPKAILEPDLARAAVRTDDTDLVFTPFQLDVYGNRELQVLEKILRSQPTAETEALLHTVAEKIQRKIDWQPPAEPVHPRRFLVAFYAAQRGRLEHKLLLGRPQEEKVGSRPSRPGRAGREGRNGG